MSARNRPVHRALTSEEHTLLEWLIANGNPDAKQYVPQLADIKVVGLCTCGCPTLDLAIGDRTERTIGSSNVLAEFDGSTAEGSKCASFSMPESGRSQNLRLLQSTTLRAYSIFLS
jgi:hypothetical protein